MKKYFYRVTDKNGTVIFDHSSDYAYRLLKLADKESKGSDGGVLSSWYFGKVETNIPDYVQYRVECGDKI